jgi:hypothetical protein
MALRTDRTILVSLLEHSLEYGCHSRIEILFGHGRIMIEGFDLQMYEISLHQAHVSAHRSNLNALSNLLRSIGPGRCARRSACVGWVGDEPCKLESPTSVSSSTDWERG